MNNLDSEDIGVYFIPAGICGAGFTIKSTQTTTEPAQYLNTLFKHGKDIY